jgi:hypothetical protein
MTYNYIITHGAKTQKDIGGKEENQLDATITVY